MAQSIPVRTMKSFTMEFHYTSSRNIEDNEPCVRYRANQLQSKEYNIRTYEHSQRAKDVSPGPQVPGTP